MKLIPLLFIATTLFAAPDSSSTEGALGKRHILLPFLGYQTLGGEELGLDLHLEANPYSVIDTLILVDDGYRDTRHARAPMFGLVYRYVHSERLFAEASFAVVHDKFDVPFRTYVPIYTYQAPVDVAVHRSNTTIWTADLGVNMPLKSTWLGLSGRVGTGFAHRNLKFSHLPENTGGVIIKYYPDVLDAESMMLVRVGADFMLWHGNQLAAQGTIYYSHFIPVDSDAATFGGIGWRVSFFPIWSSK